MTPESCFPTLSAFQWRATPEGIIELTLDCGTSYISCGSAGDINGVFARVFNKAFEATPLTWRTLPSNNLNLEGRRVGSHDSDSKTSSLREDDLKRELRLLSLVGEAVGMKLDAMRWRMLSPNAVLHPFFGPGVTVATDGVCVILFGFARFGCEYTVAHRSNVIGPVTSTAVAIEDWDYGNNSTSAKVAKVAKQVQTKASTKSAALELLASLLSVKQPTQSHL